MKQVHEQGFTMPGTILRWEPPRVLSYTFDEDSDVTFELSEQGKEVLLVLTHRPAAPTSPISPAMRAAGTRTSHCSSRWSRAPRCRPSGRRT